jgi:glycerol-3-phosphate dehydrogenase (NAD(P)+)
MSNTGVIGAGSWGTALAVTLCGNSHSLKMWDVDKSHVDDLKIHKENKRFLPGVPFAEKLTPCNSLEETLHGAEIVLFSVPTQHFSSALRAALPYIKENAVVVNAAKGIEQKTLKRMSEIAYEHIPASKYVVLSGPSHAEEVGRFIPTTLVTACVDLKTAEYVQDVFITDKFRVYTHHDVIGVELGGALKNIIALGVGISDGMEQGDNAKAAIMTRGLGEMAKLGVKLGAEEKTFSGLTGIGDLIVTCTSMHSRNRRCGIMIGEGTSPKEAMERVGMVVEGIFTTEAAYELAQKSGVEMPIIEAIYHIINGNIEAKDAVARLMGRPRKHEHE